MQEENVESKPKKRSVFKIILIIFLVVFLLIGGGVFWGYRKLMDLGSSTDLGVTYTYEDYNDLVRNLGIDVNPEELCLDCDPLTFTDPHEVDVMITDAQASAAFDIVNEKLSYGKITNSQIKFSDGKGELSTTFTYQGRDYPVYIAGTVDKDSDKTVAGEIFELKAGGITVPSGAKSMVEEALVNLANERMATMEDTFRIDKLELTDDGLDFNGKVPTKGN